MCAGLPLALRIAGARLAARPQWRITWLLRRLADETHRLDELTHRGLSVCTGLAATYAALDDQARQLFRRCWAQLPDTDYAASVAATLLNTDLATAEDTADRLVEARLLDSTAGPEPRYRFIGLTRCYARERLVAEEVPSPRPASNSEHSPDVIAIIGYRLGASRSIGGTP